QPVPAGATGRVSPLTWRTTRLPKYDPWRRKSPPAPGRASDRQLPWASRGVAVIITRMDPATLRLTFDRGTLVVTGAAPERLAELPGVQFDPRAGVHRAE